MAEIAVWSWLCHSEPGEGTLNLRQHIPEVFVFKGCSLDGWYHTNKHGVVVKRKAPAPATPDKVADAVLQQLMPQASETQRPGEPVAVLRTGFTELRGDSAPVDIPNATVLDTKDLHDVMQQVREGKREREEVWSVQAYLQPRDGVRILSVYSCDVGGDEKSDVFGRRFRKVYTSEKTVHVPEPEDVAADGGFLTIADARRSAVEGKTLGAVRFASRFHNLDFEGLVLEFIVDEKDNLVLNGCFSLSLFGPDAKRVRPSSLPQPDEREIRVSPRAPSQRVFPVPSVSSGADVTMDFQQTIPKADRTTSPGATHRQARRAADTSETQDQSGCAEDKSTDAINPLQSSMEENLISKDCRVLLEVWRGEAFLGEAELPQLEPGAPSEVHSLSLHGASGDRPPSRHDPRKQPSGGDGSGQQPMDKTSIARAMVCLSWRGMAGSLQTLAVKVTEANGLQIPGNATGVRAMLWLRRRGKTEWEPLWASREATGGGEASQPWVWDEEADLGLHPAPQVRSSSSDRRGASGKILTSVKQSDVIVAGASLSAHWGMGAGDGCMRTSTLAAQVVQRHTGKKARNSMLVHIASQLDRCHKAKTALDEYTQQVREFSTRAAEEASSRAKEIEGLERAQIDSEEAHKKKLATVCKDMHSVLDDTRAETYSETCKLNNTRARTADKRDAIQKLEQEYQELQDTLDKIVKKFDEVSSSYALIQSELARTHKTRMKEDVEDARVQDAAEAAPEPPENHEAREEVHMARRELHDVHSSNMRAQKEMVSDREWAFKLEEFIRRIARSRSVGRMGGGFDLDNAVMREAAWVIQELEHNDAASELNARAKADELNAGARAEELNNFMSSQDPPLVPAS